MAASSQRAVVAPPSYVRPVAAVPTVAKSVPVSSQPVSITASKPYPLAVAPAPSRPSSPVESKSAAPDGSDDEEMVDVRPMLGRAPRKRDRGGYQNGWDGAVMKSLDYAHEKAKDLGWDGKEDYETWRKKWVAGYRKAHAHLFAEPLSKRHKREHKDEHGTGLGAPGTDPVPPNTLVDHVYLSMRRFNRYTRGYISHDVFFTPFSDTGTNGAGPNYYVYQAMTGSNGTGTEGGAAWGIGTSLNWVFSADAALACPRVYLGAPATGQPITRASTNEQGGGGFGQLWIDFINMAHMFDYVKLGKFQIEFTRDPRPVSVATYSDTNPAVGVGNFPASNCWGKWVVGPWPGQPYKHDWTGATTAGAPLWPDLLGDLTLTTNASNVFEMVRGIRFKDSKQLSFFSAYESKQDTKSCSVALANPVMIVADQQQGQPDTITLQGYEVGKPVDVLSFVAGDISIKGFGHSLFWINNGVIPKTDLQQFQFAARFRVEMTMWGGSPEHMEGLAPAVDDEAEAEFRQLQAARLISIAKASLAKRQQEMAAAASAMAQMAQATQVKPPPQKSAVDKMSEDFVKL